MIRRRRAGWVLATVAMAGLAVWVSVAGAAPASTAAESDSAAAASVVEKNITFKDVVEKGGPMLYVLVLASVVGLAITIYLFVVLRKDQVAPNALRRELMEKIPQGSISELKSVCRYRSSALSDVTLVALDFIEANSPVDPAMLKEIMEGEGARQAASIQSQTQYLLDVGVIAPMIGLLGTVFGMVHAFNVVAFDLAKAKPMLLAAGVSEALINTAGGLIVGIPAMMFYAYFRGKASKMVSLLEASSVEIMTGLLKIRNLKP